MATLKIKNSILALSALAMISLPASATTLSGHLEENNQIRQENKAPIQSAAILNLQQTASQLNPNTFPRTFRGTWECQTTVTDSSAQDVTPGQVIDSEVIFYQTADGRTQARWNQAGWVETQAMASSFGKHTEQAKSDRTTYYFGDNAQGSWAARARDEFTQTAPDTITAKSYIDQYVDGQYVGRYRTMSVLKRTSTEATIANR